MGRSRWASCRCGPSMVETKKPAKIETPPPPPPAPEPPVEKAATPKAKAAPAAQAKAEAPPPDAPLPSSGGNDGPAVPDFGFAMGGGGGGGAGFAVAAPRAAAPAVSAAPERISRKVLSAAAAAPKDDCTETPKKPKVSSISQPAYTPEARDAQVAGKVRVEVTVDATGKVASARVLEGLGHGLDDAALAAARGATFEPGTRCGKPASATFVIAIRFAL